jgi:Holliday junction DNA helicase RuvA
VDVAANDPIGDAVSALVALGYKPNEASRMVRGVDCDGLGSEEIIRQALKGAAG